MAKRKEPEPNVCVIHHLPCTWGPDPYRSEIFEDDEDYLLCEECRAEGADDI
jgi:hypothetical protein